MNTVVRTLFAATLAVIPLALQAETLTFDGDICNGGNACNN